MPLTDTVPSSAFDVLQRNTQDTDKFVNQETGTFINRFGQEIKPIPVIESEANAAVISLGWHQVGLFADGFTYTLQNDIAKDAAGDWYRWNGSIPKVVIAGTLPSSDVNFVKIDYKSHADLSDRNPADGSAHNADDISKNGGGSLQTFIDETESFIAENNNPVSVNNALLQARIQRAANFQISGSVCILGDSITVGEGSTSLANSYSRLFFNTLQNYQQGGYGQDNEVDFNWTGMGGVALTGQTAGISGPIQRSQIIAVNGTISITRPKATKMAFFYDRTPTSGQVEVRQNGSLLATIDCSGVATKNVLSSYVSISQGGATVQFKVIGAPVEFLAIVPIGRNTSQPNISMGMRMAVSGFNTTHFLNSPDQLISIGTCGAIGTADSIYVLAVGTNDIYTAARSPTEYTNNLRTIGATLESYRPSNVIVLVVPPQANETLHPVAIPAYNYGDYKKAIYDLANEKQWAVIDHSTLQLSEQMLYADGLHPTDRGHQIMASNALKSFGLQLQSPPTGILADAINTKSDAVLYRKRADLTTFTGTTTREKTLTSLGVTASDFITGIYIRWKTSGVMIPYQDCQDLQNGLGMQILRSFSGAEYSVAKIFYKSVANDGTGFASPQGALSSNILNTVPAYNDAEVIVEFIRSLKISV